ncbi:MAG: thiolase domain-containing protein [Halobacteriales archaeon]|nr:thiolase domain-containing protein [Halobacteriales archaeon]
MRVTVSGAYSTKFGKHPGSSARELLTEACLGALDEADMTPEAVDEVHVGNFMGELTDDQGHMGVMTADYLGTAGVSATRSESACASSGWAFRNACAAVEAGIADVTLVAGVEMMHATGIERLTDALADAADNEYENSCGLTFPGIFALIARDYMDEFGVTREDLAEISVKNRANGVRNPVSQYQEEVTVEDVLEARPIAPPVSLLDSCPITDGASAVVLVSPEYADDEGIETSAVVVGSGASTDTLALQDRDALSRTLSAERAAERAYENAGVTPEDIDVVEVHDCFTVAEALAVESLGFFERGEGAYAAVEGETASDGRIPVNTSGGLLAKGHPVGATGVAQIVELTKQLEGRHPTQVEDAEVAVAHNVGGSGASTTVHVLQSEGVEGVGGGS